MSFHLYVSVNLILFHHHIKQFEYLFIQMILIIVMLVSGNIELIQQQIIHKNRKYHELIEEKLTPINHSCY